MNKNNKALHNIEYNTKQDIPFFEYVNTLLTKTQKQINIRWMPELRWEHFNEDGGKNKSIYYSSLMREVPLGVIEDIKLERRSTNSEGADIFFNPLFIVSREFNKIETEDSITFFITTYKIKLPSVSLESLDAKIDRIITLLEEIKDEKA